MVVLGTSGLFLDYLSQPYQDDISKQLENCKEPDCSMTIQPNPLMYLAGLPALIAFTYSFKKFEEKSIRTWRSWR